MKPTRHGKEKSTPRPTRSNPDVQHRGDITLLRGKFELHMNSLQGRPTYRHLSPYWLLLVRFFCSNSRAMTKWEYLVVYTKTRFFNPQSLFVNFNAISSVELKGKPINEAFDILGRDGWELVTSNRTNFVGARSCPFFVFKKPLG